MSDTRYKYVILLACLFLPFQGYSQEEGKVKKFHGLSGPEKRWVLAHPFIAMKTLKVSEQAKKISDAQKDSPDLDGYGNGGQVDAFRHCFWIAALCQVIEEKKALKLGMAHEKGNEKDYKKRKTEDGELPDMIASTMDLWNNQVGAALSRENPGVTEEVLVNIVKLAVTSGKCKIIKRNAQGAFLDAEGNVLKEADWKGKWVNERCLVMSDKTVN